MKLPKAEQNLAEWQTTIRCLIGAAEGRDFLMHAHRGAAGASSRKAREAPGTTPQARKKLQNRSISDRTPALKQFPGSDETIFYARRRPPETKAGI
jgi:hypothetical protein